MGVTVVAGMDTVATGADAGCDAAGGAAIGAGAGAATTGVATKAGTGWATGADCTTGTGAATGVNPVGGAVARPEKSPLLETVPLEVKLASRGGGGSKVIDPLLFCAKADRLKLAKASDAARNLVRDPLIRYGQFRLLHGGHDMCVRHEQSATRYD
jgi:hypothetical protein